MRPRHEQLRITFPCELEARYVYQEAKLMASEYGRVTLADIQGIIGNHCCYDDTKIYWTAALLDTDVKVYPELHNNWCLHFLDYLTDESEDEKEDNANESHSIYINITTSDMDDPDCILCSVLAHAQKISDRDIFVNIY